MVYFGVWLLEVADDTNRPCQLVVVDLTHQELRYRGENHAGLLCKNGLHEVYLWYYWQPVRLSQECGHLIEEEEMIQGAAFMAD